MQKCLLLFYLGLLISGCSAIGVISSSDPEIKINQAYALLDHGRAFPAKRLFDEVIEIARKKNDKPLEARGIVGLADIYKTKAYGAMKENLTNYKLSVRKYNEAATLLTDIGYNKRATTAYLGAGWASSLDNDKPKACEYYQKSELAYQKPSANAQDIMNPQLDNKEQPFLKNLEVYKAKAGCR